MKFTFSKRQCPWSIHGLMCVNRLKMSHCVKALLFCEAGRKCPHFQQSDRIFKKIPPNVLGSYYG